MEAGTLTDLKISPTIPTVQQKTSYKVQFNTSNNFSDDGKIVVQMPKLIKLEDVGATVQVQPINGSIRSTYGRVI